VQAHEHEVKAQAQREKLDKRFRGGDSAVKQEGGHAAPRMEEGGAAEGAAEGAVAGTDGEEADGAWMDELAAVKTEPGVEGGSSTSSSFALSGRKLTTAERHRRQAAAANRASAAAAAQRRRQARQIDRAERIVQQLEREEKAAAKRRLQLAARHAAGVGVPAPRIGPMAAGQALRAALEQPHAVALTDDLPAGGSMLLAASALSGVNSGVASAQGSGVGGVGDLLRAHYVRLQARRLIEPRTHVGRPKTHLKRKQFERFRDEEQEQQAKRR
jgi:hypothetical protein